MKTCLNNITDLHNSLTSLTSRRGTIVTLCAAATVICLGFGALYLTGDAKRGVRSALSVPAATTRNSSSQQSNTSSPSPTAGVPGISGIPGANPIPPADGSNSPTQTNGGLPATPAGPVSPLGPIPTAGSTPTSAKPGTPNSPASPNTPATGWVNTTGGGLKLTITVPKASVAPGELVTFRATVQDPDGGLKGLSWNFGDGTTASTDTKTCKDDENRPTVDNGATNFPTTMAHVYRKAGTFAVSATALTGSRCGANAADDAVTARGTVNVDGPGSGSNGPQSPTVKATVAPGTMPEDAQVSLNVSAADTDGFINQIIIDWGDGSAPTLAPFDLKNCVDPNNSWPSSLQTAAPTHTYATAGVYNIAVTVTSVGCDGSTAQQGVAMINGVSSGSASTAASTPPTTA